MESCDVNHTTSEEFPKWFESDLIPPALSRRSPASAATFRNRVHLDGLQAFGNCAVVVAEEGAGPSAKGVALGRRKSIDGTGVEVDRLPVLAGHLLFVAFLEEFSSIWRGSFSNITS
jgi:hypothetical protein